MRDGGLKGENMFKKILLLAFLLVSLQARVVLDSDNKKVEVPDVIERATPLIGHLCRSLRCLAMKIT